VDAYFTPWALGRYANDASGVGRVDGIRNNAQYEIKTRGGEKRVFIVATRKINANDEVLVSYGNDYWKNLDKTKHLYDKLQIKLKAERIARKATKEKLNKKK
jgi:SET domain-containing protein